MILESNECADILLSDSLSSIPVSNHQTVKHIYHIISALQRIAFTKAQLNVMFFASIKGRYKNH